MNTNSDDSRKRSRNVPFCQVTWPYIAGFIDCDGWITWRKPKVGRLRVVCGLTQSIKRREGMEVIQKFLEEQGLREPLIVRAKSWKSDVKMVNIMISARTSVITLLEKVIPFILLKREIAIEALELASQIEQERIRKQPTRTEANIQVTRHREFWTNEEVKLLKRYTEEGYNATAIAAILNRSCHAVISKRSKLRNSSSE